MTCWRTCTPSKGGKFGVVLPRTERLPRGCLFLWPVIPFLYLWPLPLIGRGMYATSRTLERVIFEARSLAEVTRMRTQRAARAIVIVSALILYGVIVTQSVK